MTVLNFVLCLSLLCGLCAGLSIKDAPRPITDEATLTELRNNVTTHLRSAIHIKPYGSQLDLLTLHSATSQTVPGTLYKILAEFRENYQTSNCTLSWWEKPWEGFVKIDVECGGDEAKRLYTFIGSAERSTEQVLPDGYRIVGLPFPLSQGEIEKLHPRVTESFTKLGSKYDDFDLVVKRIPNGAVQGLIFGTGYILTVEATNPKDELTTCEADIWDKPSDFYRLKLTCQEKIYEIQL